MSNTIDKRIHAQMEHILSVLPQSGFALNTEFLIRLKRVVQSDINLYTIDGDMIATTIPDDMHRELLPLIDPKMLLNRLIDDGNKPIFVDRVNKGDILRVAYYLINTSKDTQPAIISLMISTKDVSIAKRKSTLIVGIVGLVGVIVMFFLGNRIAKGITTPLQDLVITMEDVAEGNLHKQVEIKSDNEIGRLAYSFNSMIKRLRDSEEKLIQSEKLSLAGKLAAGIAHELRNPLSSIKMLVQMFLTKHTLDKYSKRSLEVILIEIEKMESSVKEFLDLSKQGSIQTANENIINVIDDVVRLTEGQFKHRKIKLKREFNPSLPNIPLDRDKLKQAFLNLLLNSAESMPKGGEITIKVHIKDRMLKIEIKDEGSGIPEGMEEKIFEPFFTTKEDGIGLGLSNTKRIIEQHGGWIWLKRHKDGGTISNIVLPLS